MQVRPGPGNQREELSEREKDILRLVARGASNKEIGAELDISANTVKVHLRNVFAKLDVRSRTEASMVAVELGLVQPAGMTSLAAGATAEGEQVAQRPTPAPVLLWQRLVVVAALALAAAAAFWPRSMGREGLGGVADALVDATTVAGGGSSLADVGRWRELAQMPRARARFAAAMVGREIVVAGGDCDSGVTASVEVYNVDSNTWRLARSKPIAVSNASAVAVGSLIYVLGGYTGDGSVTDAVEVYDPVSDSWRAGPALPRPLCSYAAAADAGHVYVFGGWDGQAYTGAAYCLDVSTGRWTALPDLPYARGHGAAAMLRGMVYVAGGYDGSRTLARVDVLDIGAGGAAWTTAPPLEEPRAGLALVAVGDTLYALGGGWSAPVTRAEKLEAGAEAWRSVDAPVAGRWRNMAAVGDGTSLYAMGGWNEALLSGLFSYQAVYSVMIPLAR